MLISWDLIASTAISPFHFDYLLHFFILRTLYFFKMNYIWKQKSDNKILRFKLKKEKEKGFDWYKGTNKNKNSKNQTLFRK